MLLLHTGSVLFSLGFTILMVLCLVVLFRVLAGRVDTKNGRRR